MQSWSAQNSSRNPGFCRESAAASFVREAGVADVQYACSEDSRRGAWEAGRDCTGASAAVVRRDRRNKRGGGAIADTTIRCGCDEAICASYVVAAEVRQAADAQASSALPRAAAREEATDDQHGPVRSGVARKHLYFMSQGATPANPAVDACESTAICARARHRRETGGVTPTPSTRTTHPTPPRETRTITQARSARGAEARAGHFTTLKREDHPAVTQSGRGSGRGR